MTEREVDRIRREAQRRAFAAAWLPYGPAASLLILPRPRARYLPASC